MTSDSSSHSIFSLCDSVFNQRTGHAGSVIGYGYKIVDNVYVTTIKVLVESANDSARREFVEKDLYSNLGSVADCLMKKLNI